MRSTRIPFHVVSYFKRNLIPFSQRNRDIEFILTQSRSEIIGHKKISFKAAARSACPRHLAGFPQALIAFKFYDIVAADTDMKTAFFAFLRINNHFFQKISVGIIERHVDLAVTFACVIGVTSSRCAGRIIMSCLMEISCKYVDGSKRGHQHNKYTNDDDFQPSVFHSTTSVLSASKYS